MTFHAARQVVLDAIAHRAFPGAVVEVGTAAGPLWKEAFGSLTYDAEAPTVTEDTIFDLASLTKVIATTTLVMGLVETEVLRLHDPVARWVPRWRHADRLGVTIEQLLTHSSGLPAWLPLFRSHRGRRDFEAAIAGVPLEYEPDTKSIYSDLGFMLLGLVVEEAAGASLAELFERQTSTLALGRIGYLPRREWRLNTAPTEFDPWRGRLLVGEVHDENAAALEGIAGHAGLFGTIGATGRFARGVLAARRGRTSGRWPTRTETVLRFTSRAAVPGSSRALGWDTMLPTSSCGTEMSADAFGHTGFTGTSVWVDPTLDLYVVLLTNRVHPSRQNTAIQQVRPAFHDAIVGAVRIRESR